jgi:hypothetical protein
MLTRLTFAALALTVVLTACDSGGSEDIDVSALEAFFDCDVRAISTGSAVNGSLASGDCQLDDGSFIDYYAFRIDETTSVTIEHSSSDIDPYLFLFGASGGLIEQNDDATEGTLNSLIERTLQAGTYAIGANSFDGGEVGAYRVRVTLD